MNERLPKNVGEVGILNVGEGDTKISFDPSNPAERQRAARIVKDMLRRGYSLLVEHPAGSGSYTRALEFREDVCEYVIADFDSAEAEKADAQESEHGSEQGQAQAPAAAGGTPQAPAKRSYRKRTVSAESTRAVGVARVAGG
jgi:hypothetical protein